MAKVETPDALQHLKLLNFKLNANNCWKKTYSGGCEIQVQLQEEKIFYPEEMNVEHESTSNFEFEENFVVLECVDRLLSKGYRANRIELEKTWNLGRKEKGRLDILVRCKNENDIYLMIECKTHDSYEDEKKNIIRYGGQLFSYFQQDRTTKFLCLYASRIENFRYTYDCSVIPIIQPYRDAKNMEEMYNAWDKVIRNDGVFEKKVPPYKVEV